MLGKPSEVDFCGRRVGAGEALGTSNGELMMAAINRFLVKVGAEYLGHPANSRKWEGFWARNRVKGPHDKVLFGGKS